MKSRLSAILLAAGASTRMGRPKALLEYCGETFLDIQTADIKSEFGAQEFEKTEDVVSRLRKRIGSQIDAL